MIVTSNGIRDGVIADKYGKRGTYFIDGIPALSLPFNILSAPENTKSFAVILKDNDAIAVAGYPWIHWLLSNLQQNEIPENASRNNPNLTQGENSWKQNYYGGMTPPNAPHRYDLSVYALDIALPLKTGFTEADLVAMMDEHILDEFTLSGFYSN